MSTEKPATLPEEDKSEEGEQQTDFESKDSEQQPDESPVKIVEDADKEGGESDKAECTAEDIDAGECVVEEKASDVTETEQDSPGRQEEEKTEDTEDSAKEAA